MTAWEYIQTHDSLSLYEEAITLTGLEASFQQNDAKTFVAPNNDAFESYMSENGYATLKISQDRSYVIVLNTALLMEESPLMIQTLWKPINLLPTKRQMDK